MTFQEQLEALMALRLTLLASDVSTDEQDEALEATITLLRALHRHRLVDDYDDPFERDTPDED